MSLSELGDALVSARGEPDSVKQLVLQKIQQEFDKAGLNFRNGSLLVEDDLLNRTVDDGCNSTVINRMHTEIEVAQDSALSLQLDSLYEPLTLQVELVTHFAVEGVARQTFGFRFGSCQQVARDTFTFTANGPLSVRLAVAIELNPVWAAEDTLRLTPVIALDGELLASNIRVDVDDSVLRSLLEEYLQDEVESLLNPGRLREEIAQLQDSVNQQLAEALDSPSERIDESATEGGTLDVVLPKADDEQIVALYELLTPQARFPLTAGFISENRFELLAALLLDDSDTLNDLLQNALECELTNVLQTDLPLPVAYSNRGGLCQLEPGFKVAGALYSDASCGSEFDYYPTTLLDFCSVALSSELLGNAGVKRDQLARWTLSPGTRFDVGALSIKGKQQPYVQRHSYKRVETSAGVCDLEMRVYSSDPNGRNRKALMALHGGSWQYRGTGFLGVENMATHFTNAGFVVFAPFYRLIGDSDGTAACQMARLQDLIDDVDDALTWVSDNQASYGVSGKPILFGQSAGGHLAASIAVRQPKAVERSVLFYAPVDFRDFANQIKTGSYDGGQGRRILQAVTGQAVEELDLDSQLVTDNSFPPVINAQPHLYPPFFMLHGQSDSLLPWRQSERMCDGLAGALEVDGGPATSIAVDDDAYISIGKSVACDNRGSQLHLIAQGEHTLDLCLSDELCLSGSPASAAATADVIQSMIDWSAADTLTAYKPATSSNDSGSGRIDSLSIGLLVMMWLLRWRVARQNSKVRRC